MEKQPKPGDIVVEVAKRLGFDKIRWGAATKLCKEAMNDGFTLEDFLQAVEGMKAGDKKYWSVYSIFTKPDLWMSKATKKEENNGSW